MWLILQLLCSSIATDEKLYAVLIPICGHYEISMTAIHQPKFDIRVCIVAFAHFYLCKFPLNKCIDPRREGKKRTWVLLPWQVNLNIRAVAEARTNKRTDTRPTLYAYHYGCGQRKSSRKASV